jgi:branched-chain amino acid transport system ATP-binding protein
MTMTASSGSTVGGPEVPIALSVAHVSVRFGGLQALDDVNLSAGSGEIVGLIGPNGAGKTTLLNVITGLIRPNGGTVTLSGVDCGHRSVHRRARLGLARTFQRVTLFGELSVRQHVQLAQEAASGLTGHRERPASSDDQWGTDDPDALLRRLGLRVRGDANVDGLPLGNARLVELAMAMASRPKVLLLDEPFSGLGSNERDHLSQLLGELTAQTKVAIVLVEHDVDIVSRIADRVVVLDFGRVIGDGPPAAVLADPVVRKAYFGMAGMGDR